MEFSTGNWVRNRSILDSSTFNVVKALSSTGSSFIWVVHFEPLEFGGRP